MKYQCFQSSELPHRYRVRSISVHSRVFFLKNWWNLRAMNLISSCFRLSFLHLSFTFITTLFSFCLRCLIFQKHLPRSCSPDLYSPALLIFCLCFSFFSFKPLLSGERFFSFSSSFLQRVSCRSSWPWIPALPLPPEYRHFLPLLAGKNLALLYL